MYYVDTLMWIIINYYYSRVGLFNSVSNNLMPFPKENITA